MVARIDLPHPYRQPGDAVNRPATITQADVARVIRAAKKAGASEVEVRVGGASVVVRLSTGKEEALETKGEVVL